MVSRRVDVGILGATGMVGQQFIMQLANHPWFRIAWLGASERSEGKKYRDLAWRLSAPRPAEVDDMVVEAAAPGRAPRLMFSGLDSKVAGDIEREFAAAGHFVVSNARNYRMEQFVPLLVPEVNPDHLALIPLQQQSKGWKGAIVTNPNCATVPLVMALAAARQFEPARVTVSTMQAVSGAGYPGVPSLDILGNLIPFIDGEEEKIQTESLKIMGTLQTDRVVPHPMVVSAQTTRVPVINGHTETISVQFNKKPSLDELKAAFRVVHGQAAAARLPVGAEAAAAGDGRSESSAAAARRRARRRHGGVPRTRASVPGFRLQVRGVGAQYGPRRRRCGGAERGTDAGGEAVGSDA